MGAANDPEMNQIPAITILALILDDLALKKEKLKYIFLTIATILANRRKGKVLIFSINAFDS